MDILFNKTKIIATVGPACNTKEKLIELAKAGVDIFRLNFSHGSKESHLEVIQSIREINQELGLNLCIIQDLQGPKIRTGEIENGEVEIVKGDTLAITIEKMVGNKERVSTSYELLPKDVNVGDTILIDDGNIELLVTQKNDSEVITKIIYGGILKSKKGINLPNTDLSTPSLTKKDTEDLMFGLEHHIEWVALSFVRTPTDILLLKHLIQQKGSATKVIAKIEKPEAIKNIDEIINVSDALMVARGDLGVEINMETVPVTQKMIVKKCSSAAKPVIIATQMMESMINNPRPTRAETNDIANAVVDGADVLMLSGETAVGKYPKLVIQSMSQTIKSVEENVSSIYHKNFSLYSSSSSFYSDSLVAAACTLAKQTGAKGIIGMTHSGYTAFRIASHRPEADIFIFTGNKPILSTLNLIWGVRAFYYDKFVSTDETFQDVQDILVQKEHLKKGDVLILMASMPIKKKQRTNALKVLVVE